MKTDWETSAELSASPAAEWQIEGEDLLKGYKTAARVMRRYSISHSTLYKWIGEGRFPPPVKIGPRAVRWRAEDLRAYEASFKPSGK